MTTNATPARPAPAWFLVAALFGLFVPNGLFIYWLAADYHGLAPVLHDRLALGFILDAVLATALLAWRYARHPIGPRHWSVFVALSLVGGLGFSLPLYWWLNARQAER